MPVVPATRFERYVRYVDLLLRYRGKIAVSDEILCIGRVGLSDREDHFALESRFGIRSGRILRPHLFGESESSPSLGPSGIKSDVGNNFGDFGTGDPVLLGRLEVVGQGAVGDALTDQRSKGYQTAIAQSEPVGAAPHLTEKYIVVEFREFGSEFSELFASSRLFDLFLCHNCCTVYCHCDERKDNFDFHTGSCFKVRLIFSIAKLGASWSRFVYPLQIFIPESWFDGKTGV